MIGKSFSHYKVIEKIGVGGMGEVYRAEDFTLRRDVAIKVLPPHLLDDPERLARFEREAHVLASLDHPGIASVYGFEECEGNRCLVMELVEGEDLAQRLERGPLPFDEVIPIARQIAEALESAHEKGVIHRDLKPANIKLRPDGRVKVLDFGLAKAIEGDASEERSNLSALPTVTGRMTGANVILGTAAYMSPEQARGRVLDKRSDIWAYGCVLFELLSGKHGFDGDTISDTLASVLKSDPDWNLLPATTPAHLRGLINRCLTKDPRQRLRDIGEARILLGEGDKAQPGSAAVETATPRRGVPVWVAVLLALLVVASAVLTRALVPTPSAETIQGAILMPPGHFPMLGSGGHLAFSPDGKRIAFAAQDSNQTKTLWIRNLTDGESHQLSGTEEAMNPFWSPDGQLLGFFAQGKMKKIPVTGGAPVSICNAPNGRGATWREDGSILFAPNFSGELSEVNASGGEPIITHRIGRDSSFVSRRWPQSIPGAGLLYTEFSGSTGIYYQPKGDTSRLIVKTSCQGIYRDGSVLYMTDDVLFARPFDAGRGLFTAEPKTIATGVFVSSNYGRGAFTAAPGGHIAYIAGNRVSQASRLVFHDRDGVVVESHDLGALIRDIALSPDATRMAYSKEDPDTGELDIWILDLNRDVQSRLTFRGDADDPVWSPEGTRLAYAAGGDIFIRSATGVGDEQTVSATTDDDCTHDWSPDGRYLTWSRSRETLELVIYDLEQSKEQTLLKGQDYKQGQFSPDGRWIAYVSNESGRDEIYVRDFPSLRGRWQISGSGATNPQWGKGEIVYLSNGNILRVEVDTDGEALEIGRSQTLFSSTAGVDRSIQLALASSGDGIWYIKDSLNESANKADPIRFILNWKDE